jgi:hypothetical protein
MTVQKAPRKQKRAPCSKGITEVSALSIPEETFPHTMDTKSAPHRLLHILDDRHGDTDSRFETTSQTDAPS